MWTVPKYDGTTKRWRFNRNRTGDIPNIFKKSTPLSDTRKKLGADKSEPGKSGEPGALGATTTAKGAVSNKPYSTAKRSHKQPVAAPSKTLESCFKRKPVTNKQQQSSSLLLPQPKRLRKGTS
ncbi:hypothetical protein GGH92_004646 [Coemansia sp. RSA 2673]|nr:hypothetical protein GGH92_004646 [Coemansia sp. RSA 2673]